MAQIGIRVKHFLNWKTLVDYGNQPFGGFMKQLLAGFSVLALMTLGSCAHMNKSCCCKSKESCSKSKKCDMKDKKECSKKKKCDLKDKKDKKNKKKS